MTIANLPYPKKAGIQWAEKHVLLAELVVEQWIVPKGTIILLWTSTDFGNVLLPISTKDSRGFVIPNRWFRY